LLAQKLSFGQNVLAQEFFLVIDILSKLQQRIFRYVFAGLVAILKY